MLKFKLLIVLSIVSLLSLNSYSQIKVFPNNKISFGTTSNPMYLGIDKLFFTSKTIFSNSSSSITSSALIRGNHNYSSATTPDFTWYYNDQTGLFHPSANTFAISSNGIERFRIDSKGRITFQNTDNSYYGLTFQSIANNQTSKMYIVNYNNNNTFYVTGKGNIYSRGVYVGSDISFKEDINTINSALDKVLKLRGVTFKMKKPVLNNPNDTLTVISNKENPTQIGVIAQEVEKIVPEVVITQSDGKKYVAYQNLVGLLIEAIKEQQNQINYLKDDLNKCCDLNNSNKSRNVNNNDNSENNLNLNSKLYQNLPNPFNTTSSIKYIVDNNAKSAKLLIFNMQGTLIKSYNNLNLGNGEIIISSNELNPGMYMYSLIVDNNEIDTKRMILTK